MSKFPCEQDAREQIVKIGKRMYKKGFCPYHDGNISCKISDDVILITPAGICKGDLDSDMLICVNMSGEVVKGDRKPTSEMKMHLKAYEQNHEVVAVVHAHPPAASAFASSSVSLFPPVLAEAAMVFGDSVPTAPYFPPGSQELADSIAPYMSKKAILLANHGAITLSCSSLFEAYYFMEELEHCALTTLYSKILGNARALNDDQVKTLL